MSRNLRSARRNGASLDKITAVLVAVAGMLAAGLAAAPGASAGTGSPPLIGIVTGSGEALVKVGSLTAPWTDENNDAYQVAVASDPVNGPLIAVVTDTSGITNNPVLVKEGSLTAPWDEEYSDTAHSGTGLSVAG